ncbi:MAG: Hpt domain-containing protein [Planctomycetota bacterium]
MSEALRDCEPIYSQLGGDPDLAEIVNLFVEEMPERVASFEGFFAAGDLEGLRRAAHQLKGAAGSYGFDPISPRAGELEAAILSLAPEDEIRRCLDELVDICQRARAGAPQ